LLNLSLFLEANLCWIFVGIVRCVTLESLCVSKGVESVVC
jgi:hypothetical protein